MSDPTHERLSSGIARLADGETPDSYDVSIVPIPEGAETTGLSGIPSRWDRDVLKDATDRGTWQGAKLLKSPGGTGHYEWDEQPPPDAIVGEVTGGEYSESVGPVLDATLLDEHLAALVDRDLVSVSPDLNRTLSDEPDEDGVKSVESIDSVDYVTILDKPASPGASIQPATAEALGMHPDDLPDDEQLAPRQTPRTPEHEGTTSGEWNAPSLNEYISSFADEDDQDVSEVSDLSAASKSAIASKTLLGRSNADTADDLLSFPVVTTENNLHESALDAVLSRAPQAEYLSEEQADALQSKARSLLTEEFDRDLEEQNAMTSTNDDPEAEQLAQLEPLRFYASPGVYEQGDLTAAASAVNDVDGLTAALHTPAADADPDTATDPELLVIIDRQNVSLDTLNDTIRSALDDTPFEVYDNYDWLDELQHEQLGEHSNQPIGADADPSDPANAGADDPTDIDPSTMGDDTTKEELREQLAAAEAQNEEYEDRIDDLEDENETLESEIESEREQRMEDTEHLRRRYAEAATTSEMAAEALVDNDDKSVEDLAEMALEAQEDAEPENEAGGGEEDDEQLSAMERYEQLAAENPNPRGGGGEDDSGGGNGRLTEDQLAAANERATAIMGTQDLRARDREQLSSREYVMREHDTDPAEYESKDAFRAAVRRNGGEA